MLQMFPLLAVSLVVYAILTFTTGTANTAWYDTQFLTIPMMSGDNWVVTGGHLFIVFSMVLLFIELLRSTKTGTASIMNHAFSVLVFIVALLLFIMMQGFGNSVFFIYMSMTFLDFMAGFIVTTVTARRDLAVGGVGVGN